MKKIRDLVILLPLYGILLLLFTAECNAAAQNPLQKGDIVTGWQVKSVMPHEEFIRYTLAKNGESTEVEVTYKRTENSSGIFIGEYLIQPAPGFSPPQAVIEQISLLFEESTNQSTGEQIVTKLTKKEKQEKATEDGNQAEGNRLSRSAPVLWFLVLVLFIEIGRLTIRRK